MRFGSDLAVRFVLVRFAPAEASAFGRRVRFVGFNSAVDAEGAIAGSGTGAGRGLAQTGELSAGSNSSWRKIAAGRRAGEDSDIAPASGIASMSTAGSSTGAGSGSGGRRPRRRNRLNASGMGRG
jgi:hypothetical protein